jgi:hypothetical protein
MPRFIVISVEDAKCSGHPLNMKTDETVDWVKRLVLENGRIAILEVDNVLGISFGSFQSSLNYRKNWRHIATKFITHLLSEG